MLQNRDVVKDLQPGMLIAVAKKAFPLIGVVIKIPLRPTEDSVIDVQWMEQEKAKHKSKWLRFFKQSSNVGIIKYSEILLYDFQLTDKGALKKKSREYLQELFQ